jgi:hypothetical protein
MQPIEIVLRMRSIDFLDREYKERSNLIGYHDLRMARGTPCHCEQCNRLRDENSKISDRIREVRYKDSQRGNGH